LDQTVAVQHGVDGALGRHANVLIEPTHQELADLARTPMRLLPLAGEDQRLDLWGKLVGVSNRAAASVVQGLEAAFLVPPENLVARLAGDAELATDIGHRFAVQKPGNEPQALVHDRTLLPRHDTSRPKEGAESVTHVSGTLCYLCPEPLNFLPSAHELRVGAISH
jgi:hypothetical protein